MPNSTYSPFPTPIDAAIAGFDRPDELQFVRVLHRDGTWSHPFFGYDYQVKNHLQGFRGTYCLHNRHGESISPLISIV